jgi:anhydro-N-acetylmuramic acid kinase
MGLYLGLMSGTSMDAIDASLVDFDVKPLRVVASSATRFDPQLKARIAALLESPDRVALDELGQVDVALAQAFAGAANRLLETAGISPSAVTGIGSHGQTLRHRPDLPLPFTWQIGDPNTLAEMTGITVVGDFRRRDVAAGGQGAPLLPVFHDHVFRSDEEDRVIVNRGWYRQHHDSQPGHHRDRLRYRARAIGCSTRGSASIGASTTMRTGGGPAADGATPPCCSSYSMSPT